MSKENLSLKFWKCAAIYVAITWLHIDVQKSEAEILAAIEIFFQIYIYLPTKNREYSKSQILNIVNQKNFSSHGENLTDVDNVTGIGELLKQKLLLDFYKIKKAVAYAALIW